MVSGPPRRPAVGPLRGWRVAAVLAILAGAGCAHVEEPPPAPPQAPQPGGKAQILVDREATKESELALAAWLIYGGARAARYSQHPPPAANLSADDFEIELAGRQAQNSFWAKERAKGAAAHAVLDKQVEIEEAGFLPELLVAIYAHPGWTVPGPTLGKLRLDEFAKRFPGDYDSRILVALQPSSGRRFPEVPGADFPDPATLPIDPKACGRAAAEREAAWKRWDSWTGRLGGVPIAARDTLDLSANLKAIVGEEPYASRGATWVSYRVGHLAFFDGYCAVDRQDWPRAATDLKRAVSLLPREETPRLELAMALNQLRQFDAALAQVDRVLDRSTDGCHVALAWRRRGFILFDMGLLESAKLAYQKSLEYEPGHPIATKELQTLATAMADRQQEHKSGRDYVPAFGTHISVSKCALKK